MPSPALDPATDRVILDTQVALDWLLFADPSTTLLARAIAAGRLQWVQTPRMRAEFAEVIARPGLAGWRPDAAALLAALDRWVAPGCAQDPVGVDGPRCRDPDDQVFIDTALACGARWLFSRDRAVLALAKPLRLRGVEVLRPADWAGPSQPA